MNTQNQSSSEIELQFTEWVKLYTKELFGWAFHKIQDKETAEDLVQDTFVAAYNAFPSFKQQSSPKTWLLAILNRKIIDYYRHQAKSIIEKKESDSTSISNIGMNFFVDNGSLKSFETANWETDSSNDLDNLAFVTEFKKCMSKLPANWQTSVKAKYIFEKNSRDICKELGITPSNYWQILHRAKLQLKQCLEHNWYKL